MAQVIDLEGLPEPVARAIAETVLNLKKSYSDGSSQQRVDKPPNDLPTTAGSVIGSLRRVDIYGER